MSRIALILFLLISPTVLAQTPSSGTQSQPTQATQLPLSGRNPQGGSVTTTQTAIPGTTNSINTINPTVQVQGPFTGSTSSVTRRPFSGRLSLREAVDRALEFNLGAVGLTEAVRQARGQSKIARSALLPNLNASLSETVQQTNLQALGVRFNFPVPGFSPPTIVGPFNFFDLRASLTQTVLDLTARNNYRATKEIARANELSVEDACDLIVLGVGGTYLQVIAARSRIEAARGQLATAEALFKQTSEQRAAGVVAQIDLNRSQIQLLTQQQRLVSLENDYSKLKIMLARLAGLPPNEQYEISDAIPFSEAPPLTFDEALKQAFEQRSDLKAAQAQVEAAERSRSAARSERLPSFAVRADYGVIGVNPSQAHGTFSVSGTVRVPIWQGGRIKGQTEVAEAALGQRQAELQDLKGRIESEVRNAYFDLQAAASQVEVARKNIQVSTQNLDLTRQKFDAGVSDNVEVVQSQEALSTANTDYINSVFAHNLAKLSLARAIGRASEALPQFLKLQ
ncbi:MAG TPA: TolC family protein [Pyrinomonadaceae bacterium]|nr:TolC family protein [Pyrinomonadaceae bacterium]